MLDYAPTVVDIERFLNAIPDHVRPLCDQEAVARGTILNGLNHIINYCVWQFEGFTIRKQDRMRIGMLFLLLVD